MLIAFLTDFFRKNWIFVTGIIVYVIFTVSFIIIKGDWFMAKKKKVIKEDKNEKQPQEIQEQEIPKSTPGDERLFDKGGKKGTDAGDKVGVEGDLGIPNLRDEGDDLDSEEDSVFSKALNEEDEPKKEEKPKRSPGVDKLIRRRAELKKELNTIQEELIEALI